MSKHILIIGGMGPQASLYAHGRVLELVRQGQDSDVFMNEDYPRITHLSINVQDFISDPTEKEKAEEYIVSCLQEINLDSIDRAFIACNTAHLLYDSLKAVLGDRLVSMVDATKEAITLSRVGIVATPSTIEARLYDGDTHRLITPSLEGLQRAELIIRQAIAGVSPESLANQLQIEIDELISRGSQKVILGCSELSMMSRYLDQANVIDPIEIIVRKVVQE